MDDGMNGCDEYTVGVYVWMCVWWRI